MNLAVVFTTISTLYGIPDGMLSALCFVESSHRPAIVKERDGGGSRASVGVCQVQERTARHLGFKGSRTLLLDPKINVKYAALYLTFQKRRYGNWTRAIVSYNKGHSESFKTNAYWNKVMTRWANEDSRK